MPSPPLNREPSALQSPPSSQRATRSQAERSHGVTVSGGPGGGGGAATGAGGAGGWISSVEARSRGKIGATWWYAVSSADPSESGVAARARPAAGWPPGGGAAEFKVDRTVRATGTIAASAMRVRTAPPFVGCADAHRPLLGVGGLRPSHSVPGRRAGRHLPSWLRARRVCGRFGYARYWVVWTPLISSLVGWPWHLYHERVEAHELPPLAPAFEAASAKCRRARRAVISCYSQPRCAA